MINGIGLITNGFSYAEQKCILKRNYSEWNESKKKQNKKLKAIEEEKSLVCE